MIAMSGKLCVLFCGVGSVASTVIAGVHLVADGKATPFGSIVELGTFPHGAARGGFQELRSRLELPNLSDLRFAGWDLLYENAYEAAVASAVLTEAHLTQAASCLQATELLPGYCDQAAVPTLSPKRMSTVPRAHALDRIKLDIEQMTRKCDCDRAIMVITNSTESLSGQLGLFADRSELLAAIAQDSPSVAWSSVYALAAIELGIPVANATPNRAFAGTALLDFAAGNRVPIAGDDLRSGQTWIKGVLAEAFYSRRLKLTGWYSTNILGNTDGMALRSSEAKSAKARSKSSLLDAIAALDPRPELLLPPEHLVNIDYFRARGDGKEAWDAVDFEGWLGYPMQLKLNLLARDSILAAPLVLDLISLLDAAARRGRLGQQEWLSVFFKTTPTGSMQGDATCSGQLALLYRTIGELANQAFVGAGPTPELGDARP